MFFHTELDFAAECGSRGREREREGGEKVGLALKQYDLRKTTQMCLFLHFSDFQGDTSTMYSIR